MGRAGKSKDDPPGGEIRNSKFEIRNKRIKREGEKGKKGMALRGIWFEGRRSVGSAECGFARERVWVFFRFGVLCFCFGFRISDFGFRI